MILRYDNKDYAKITEAEAEEIRQAHGMHLNFRGNLFKMSKVELFNEEIEEAKIWQKTTDELKEIIGDFENQLNSHKDNIPPTREGKTRAVQDGKLPNCGMHYLEDRGIMLWYLENGWLFTEKKEGEKRRWAMTQKYNLDEVWKIEEALEELQHRRIYAEEEAIKNGDPLITKMYQEEQQAKINAMRAKLQVKFGWDNKKDIKEKAEIMGYNYKFKK